MKQYIALEDVDKPQANVVRDVDICREFVMKFISGNKVENHNGEDYITLNNINKELVKMEYEA